MIFEYKSYRAFLKAILAERVSKNPAYSLRAFAKSLDITNVGLHKILKSERNLDPERAMDFAKRLGLTTPEKEYFSLLVQFESTKREDLKDELYQRILSVSPRRDIAYHLDIDRFDAISDWYHVAVIHLLGIPSQQQDAVSLAASLGISKIEVEDALARMERLDLIRKKEDGNWAAVRGRMLIDSTLPNAVLRKFHTQFLSKAAVSLETQAPDERVNGTETFAFDPALIGEARGITEHYFNEMSSLMHRSQNNSEVFHLHVNFFRLTNLAGSRP